MVKEIKNMTNKELKEELKSIEYHIKNYSFGRWGLNYRMELEKEIDKRNL